jgi:peptide/nickel transport system substrate-binding protein
VMEAGVASPPRHRVLVFNSESTKAQLSIQRLHRISIAIVAAVMLASQPAMAEVAPKRGGVLEFASTVEPGNYDCHGNTSFAFLHPVAPHYSTLLKFDTANYPQVVGDLAQSWDVSADRQTYTFKLRPNVLFHDSSRLTSADVKASYQRIAHPPAGVISSRQVDFGAIGAIETPDPLTVIFRLQWPDAAMLANFASPWNCIYSAAKLAEDSQFPKTHILGTGPYTFVEHKKGESWTGRRWDKYFQPGRPYLDGYEALFMSATGVIKAYESGRIMAEFRGVTPTQRDELTEKLGDRIATTESPWLSNLLVVFNTNKKPFNDPRVRRALSLAIDRWGAAERLQASTFLKYVGGLMRPGANLAMSEAELTTMPGFSRDIGAARTEAKRLLAEAGIGELSLTLLVRDIPIPHYAGADLLAQSWKEIGINVMQDRRNIWDWQKVVDAREFDIALDFSGDFYDDPTFQLTKYVSHDLSPVNFAGSTDRFLDALFVAQAMTTDPRERTRIVRAFERHALKEAYTVPLLWWDRIVATSSKLKGWNITPSHFLGQDLTDVWIDK